MPHGILIAGPAGGQIGGSCHPAAAAQEQSAGGIEEGERGQEQGGPEGEREAEGVQGAVGGDAVVVFPLVAQWAAEREGPDRRSGLLPRAVGGASKESESASRGNGARDGAASSLER